VFEQSRRRAALLRCEQGHETITLQVVTRHRCPRPVGAVSWPRWCAWTIAPKGGAPTGGLLPLRLSD